MSEVTFSLLLYFLYSLLLLLPVNTCFKPTDFRGVDIAGIGVKDIGLFSVNLCCAINRKFWEELIWRAAFSTLPVSLLLVDAPYAVYKAQISPAEWDEFAGKNASARKKFGDMETALMFAILQ